MARLNISSGTPWEAMAGYSRAVRVGDVVHVAGTTASDEHGQLMGGDSMYEQTRYILAKIGRALEAAGSGLHEVVRTRVYVTDYARWEEAARAHGEVFGQIRPANTLIGISALVSPQHLVEIEAEAIIGGGA